MLRATTFLSILFLSAASALTAGAASAQPQGEPRSTATPTAPGQPPQAGPSSSGLGALNAAGPVAPPARGEVGDASAANPDPYEKLNRKSYKLFVYLDRHAIRPAAVFYGHAVPHPARQGLHNVIQNVNSPVIFFNDVLQLHGGKAMQTLGRFAINSIFGVAGLVDVAAKSGIPYHDNSFGTTLGRYGVGPGPFLFIPVIGPSDVRDVVGSGVDAVSDPLTWINYSGRWAVGASRTVIGGLDTRVNADPQLKVIDATATDPYATLRSLYLQNRAAQINGGQVNVNDLPDFGPEPAADDAATTAPDTAPPTPGSAAGPADSDPASPPPPATVPQPH